MAERQAATVDDWKDVQSDDWKDVTPGAPAKEKPWIGTAPPENEGMLSSIFHAPAYGVQDIGAGVKHIMTPGRRMQGAHEVISGAGRAALPLVAPAIAAYGAGPVALAAGGSMLGSNIGKLGAEALGGNEDVSNLVGDVGSIAGGISAPRIPFKAVGGKMLDVMPETDQAMRDVAGVWSPRIKNVLGVMQRAKDARAAYTQGAAQPQVDPALDAIAQERFNTSYAAADKPLRDIIDAIHAGPNAKIAKITPPPSGVIDISNTDAAARAARANNFKAQVNWQPGQSPAPIPPAPGRILDFPSIATPKAQPHIDTMLTGLRQQEGLGAGEHLGGVPGAHYPERWAGTDSPTIKSTIPKTKFVNVNPEELGVHGGVEGTPIKGPLNTPEKIRIARELAAEIAKNSKGGN